MEEQVKIKLASERLRHQMQLLGEEMFSHSIANMHLLLQFVQ